MPQEFVTAVKTSHTSCLWMLGLSGEAWNWRHKHV